MNFITRWLKGRREMREKKARAKWIEALACRARDITFDAPVRHTPNPYPRGFCADCDKETALTRDG